ncbi:prepilin-type N-terminal cleavage/methylation domain-containing protein [Myxococcus sp. K15C18031901]|nr:prepilin-type N-terminal cleavage/methylation domain-containing protein [Myxococcus dinghuensis]MCP3097677.1 prepilin-type N-terminal cleavage/methylation domain-containing protein [Myxococcus dinghuensis]
MTRTTPPRHRRLGRAQRGLTLIEISIALIIVALLFSAAVMGIGTITGAKAKGAAAELAGTIRSLYDSAALRGKTCRLVFEIPEAKEEKATRYHAECAESAVTTSRDRDTALRDENRDREQTRRSRRTGDREERSYLASGGTAPTTDELMEGEKLRVESASRFSSFTSEELAARDLPSDVRVSVWTRQQKEPVESGVAYLYFFPQGYTEKAYVYLSQGDNTWTLDVSPLTGKVNIAGEALEVPR